MRLLCAALGAGALLLAAGGCGPEGAAGVANPAAVESSRVVVTQTPAAEPSVLTTKPTVPATKPTVPATRPAAPKPKPIVPKPVTTKKTVVEFRVIPFKKRTVTDSSLPAGEKEVRTQGANGTRRLTFEVTFVNSRQTAKVLLKQEVAKEPRSQVTAIGTKAEQEEPSGCDPNYSGGCVPIASDVDCSGGSGNGPAYVRGPVTVVGSDIYDLDRDNDGIGCED